MPQVAIGTPLRRLRKLRADRDTGKVRVMLSFLEEYEEGKAEVLDKERSDVSCTRPLRTILLLRKRGSFRPRLN